MTGPGASTCQGRIEPCFDSVQQVILLTAIVSPFWIGCGSFGAALQQSLNLIVTGKVV
jgi:hypothetical protein